MGIVRNRAWVWAVLGVVVVALVIGAALSHGFIYWRAPDAIEAHLRRETPIGSSSAAVLAWLRTNGRSAELTNIPLRPHSEYPPTEVGSSSFIDVVITR